MLEFLHYYDLSSRCICLLFLFIIVVIIFCSLLIEELEDKQRLIQKKITKLEQKLEDYKREMDVIDSHMENLSSQGHNRSLQLILNFHFQFSETYILFDFAEVDDDEVLRNNEEDDDYNGCQNDDDDDDGDCSGWYQHHEGVGDYNGWNQYHEEDDEHNGLD